MSDQSHMAESGPSQRTVEIAVALSRLAFGIIILIGSLQVGIDWGVEGPRPGFFPFYISLFIIVASIFNLVQATSLGGIKQGLFSSWEQLRRVLSVVVPATVYVALVPFLGMYVSSILLIGVFMMWLGGIQRLEDAADRGRRAGRRLHRVRALLPDRASEGPGRILAGAVADEAAHARDSGNDERHDTRSGTEARWKKSPT